MSATPISTPIPIDAPQDTPVLERLKRGVRRFQRGTYPAHAALYQKLASRPQQPHTLVITCADSRIDIETLMDAAPGELFVMRNIGNIVPAYGEMMGGVSAVVEYAIGVRAYNASGEEKNTNSVRVGADAVPPSPVDSLRATPLSRVR